MLDFKNFKPCFLIAMPDLKDPYFEKAVVLLTEYHKSGASGFVVNRPTNVRLGDAIVLTSKTLNPDYHDTLLWFGGPVNTDQIWIVYDGRDWRSPGDTCLNHHIMIARNMDILTGDATRIHHERLRVFHGYSGWGAGQLAQELARNTWISAPLSLKLLFETPPGEIWQKAIRSLGFDPDRLVGGSSPFVQ